jgi:hypothetical protein
MFCGVVTVVEGALVALVVLVLASLVVAVVSVLLLSVFCSFDPHEAMAKIVATKSNVLSPDLFMF